MASSHEGEANPSTITSEQYFMTLEPKVRFEPTDQELVTHFLKRKMSGDPVPMNIIIDEPRFYNYTPAQLSKMYGFANQKAMYFLVWRYVIQTRQAGNGFWKQFGTCQEIKEGDEIIGWKKLLRFYVGSRKDAAITNWAMLEYATDPPNVVPLKKFFLYKVYEKRTYPKSIQDLNYPAAARVMTRDEQLLFASLIKEVSSNEREKRRCLSKNSSHLPVAIACTSSYLKPCSPELPSEIIFEILSWLPVESLLRFMCVCKNWCSRIQDYDFVKRQTSRAKQVQISFYSKWETDNIAVIFDENFKQISCFGGLILEKSLHSQVFRIRNVVTHQVLFLPFAQDQGTGKSSSMDFAFISSTGDCKVAYFYCKSEENQENSLSKEVGFKVLTIGKDDQWRPLKLPNQNDKWELRQRGKSVLKRHPFGLDKVDGFAHLVEIIRDGQDLYLETHSFDVWSESFTSTILPQRVFADLEKVLVFRWHHLLALADIADEALNVLVLEDSRQHRWRGKKIIIPLNFLNDNPRLEEEIIPFRVLNDTLELHGIQNDQLKTVFLYHLRKETILKFTSVSPATRYTEYTPSLVTLKGMRLKRVVTKNEGEINHIHYM